MMKRLFALGCMFLMMIMNCESAWACEMGATWPVPGHGEDAYDYEELDWSVTKENVYGTDFEINVEIRADQYGTYEEYGIIICDSKWNVVVEDTQSIWLSTQAMDVWYNVYDLQPDEEYCYQVYVVFEDEYYYGPVRFIQTGTVD